MRIEKIDMNWAGRTIRADKKRLQIKYPGNDDWLTLQNVHNNSNFAMGFISV